MFTTPLSGTSKVGLATLITGFASKVKLQALANLTKVKVSVLGKFGKVIGNTKVELIKELSSKGIRFTKEDVMFIQKIRNDTIFWLEKGDVKSGYIHIFKRRTPEILSRFEQMIKGGTVKNEKELINLLFNIIKTGKKSINSRGFLFTKNINGKTVGVATGTNGYIVTVTYQ